LGKAGGSKNFRNLDKSLWLCESKTCVTNSHIHPEWLHLLEVLLDQDGLKAAYGKRDVCDRCGEDFQECTLDDQEEIDTFDGGCATTACDFAAHSILDAWLCCGPEAAVETAYQLLPKHD